MANDCVLTIWIKRRCQQQNNRENYGGESKDFYRNSVFIPYLDNLLSQPESRFHQINLSVIRALHSITKNLDLLIVLVLEKVKKSILEIPVIPKTLNDSN